MTEGAVVVEEEQGRVGQDPGVDALRDAVFRLRRALAAHPARLPDREAAEDELAALDSMAREGQPEVARLHRSLLLVVGAVGSVSALAAALGELRAAVDRLGGARVPEQGSGRSAGRPACAGQREDGQQPPARAEGFRQGR
ncbi:DUF5955 family protein [Streptomyces sp. NPDC020667]|uniref:DUF5955 family protein n=1 Tax=Streptomyces sp. NPDC020667 TaxID=3154895 RepID=UPI0033C4B4F3